MMNGFALLQSTAVFALLATATIGMGAPLAALLRLRPGDRISRLVWEGSLGLLAATTLLGWVGQGGGLHRGAIVAATCAVAVIGCVRLWQLFATSDAFAAETRETVSEPPRWLLFVLGGCALAAIAAAFLTALAPPTAGDAIVYHLELPKRFLQSGGLTFNPDDDNIVYPLVAEMGFLWALAFDDAAAATLMHWGCGLLLIGATYVLARPLIGPGWGFAAACVTALTPGVNNQMTAPLNDVALALYAVLALAAWLQARRDGTARDFVLVGLLLGGAIGVKYTGLVFAGAMAAVWLVAAIEDHGRRRKLLAGAVWAVAAVVVVAGLWYGRAAWYRGDPLYPFLSGHTEAAGPSVFPEKKTPLGRGPTAVMTAPWLMTMEPQRFGGRGHQLGPLFLMFVPVAIACRSSAALATPLWIAAIYGCGCLVLRQNIRFLLPIVPVLATAVAAVWRDLLRWPRVPQLIGVTATAGVVLLLTAVPLARMRHTLPTTLGSESFAEYLDRTEPTYAVAEWINANLPAESRILSQEQRAFYLKPAVTRENLYRRRTRYDALFTEAAELGPRLRSDGFSHLLTAEVTGSPTASCDVTLSRWADEAVATGSPVAPVAMQEWRHVDEAGTARRYRLWELR